MTHIYTLFRLGEVRVGSAKSLLFSFALRQPLDDGTRNSKEALYAHLPSYTIDRDALRLPAFFGSVASTFWLPQFCHDQSKKVKEGTLALMACVRLYQHGLLSERLLPLSRQEVFERIWPKDQPFPSKCHNDTSVSLASIIDGTTLFQYSIRLESKELTPVKRVLNPNNHHLTILTCQCLDDVPNYIHPHRNFGLLKASLQTKQQIVMNRDDMAIVSEFFSAIFNGRWKRRSHSFAFRPVKDDDTMSHIGFYAVGIVNELNILDIELMRLMILESKRDPIERQFAVMSVTNDENLYVPRLWSPQYNDKSTYVAHGPAGKSCGSQFLCNSNQSDVGTYQDYFRVKFGIHVQLDEPLFQCQHLWELPCSYSQVSVTQDSDPSATITKPMKSDVLLPKSLCLETCTVANAGIFLESVVLPQFLFHVERHLTGFLFANFCRTEFPTLGQCLDIANSEEIVGLLSAKSSADHHTYERLEWLGDAVLKLVQTDAILMSLELRDWVSKLHEGELDFIRSGMCCNSHLFSICQRTGFDRFVRTRMLQRGRWSPSSLELFCPNGTLPVDEQPADKVYADVIEAILGFVYTASGYKIARKVAKELGLTPPYAGDANETIDRELVEPKVNFVYGFMLATKKFAGYTTCQKPKLLVEAFTHATDVNSGTSSYQRLEWIGDAVLSLAVRQWIFEAFPFADPGEMVLREEPVITNESLAFLCLRSGLHKYLRHRDQTLPARIELFEAAVQSMGTGLWMSDCYPKPMADLVESVLGYIHCDGGFEAGQKAALFVTSPVLALYQSKATDELRLHPKRRLLEYGGDFFAFEATNNPHLSNPSQPINGSLASVHIDENKNVVVTCLRNGILSLSDSSLSLVTNRASAIIGSVLDNNPALSQRFQLARDKIIKKVKRRVLPKN